MGRRPPKPFWPKGADGREVYIFEMNDCDWVAARDAEEAKECYKKSHGSIESEPRAMTMKDARSHRYHDDDGDRPGRG